MESLLNLSLNLSLLQGLNLNLELFMIGKDVIEAHGLTEEEYNSIVKLLGREPNLTELGIFSVMWSEHCSYKSSIIHLKKFPTSAPHVLQGPGENAGVIDIGDGLAAVFKMESHNHPSFIEPYQGAATGVGGILRDIFTMGARPIALLNSLRFGSLDKPGNKNIIRGVVSGIAGYGNCIGVPTVGGEIYSNEIYNQNPLVNVLCLGIAKRDRIFKGRATGVGNPVIYLGSKTGRDGIHGATMASEEFGDGLKEKKPTVQVGDPFTGKLLMEACLELMEKDLVIGIQDMGAAGLTCSSCEMASRGGTGIEIELSRVPLRENGMTPYEIMLSESQERMLLVAEDGREDEVISICKKWGIDASVVGVVAGDGMIRVRERGKVVAEIPSKALTDDTPRYNREMRVPSYLDVIQSLDINQLKEPYDYNDILLRVISSPNIASKEWAYEQYDHMVRTNTVVRPGSDAAVIRIKGTNKSLALTTDCNSRYCLLNPYMGSLIAVAEAARNLAVSGARPLAVTDCLNLGNPERPEVMWQFAMAIEGISDACKRLDIPVVSGNVSFYNETKGLGVYPTPVIGMVGLIDRPESITTQWFKDEGDIIVLLGDTDEEIGGSEYLWVVYQMERGIPPYLHFEKEAGLNRSVLEAISIGIIRSAHDLSEGGLGVALAEGCISRKGPAIGASIFLKDYGMRPDLFLFSESQSRAIVTVKGEHLDDIFRIAAAHGVPAARIGVVEGDSFRVTMADRGMIIDIKVKEIEERWREAIRNYV